MPATLAKGDEEEGAMKAIAWMGAAGAAAVVVALGAAGASHAGWFGPEAVRSGDVQGTWPLTVSQINLECRDDLAIFAKVGDKTYPLNGQAERTAPEYGKPVGKLEDIQKNDPWSNQFIPGAKMSMEPVMKLAIAKCEKEGKWKL
jgi:hypothetical protein